MACGEFFGHEDCNFITVTAEREGHRADRDSWQRSKNKQYKNKIAAQYKRIKK